MDVCGWSPVGVTAARAGGATIGGRPNALCTLCLGALGHGLLGSTRQWELACIGPSTWHRISSPNTPGACGTPCMTLGRRSATAQILPAPPTPQRDSPCDSAAAGHPIRGEVPLLCRRNRSFFARVARPCKTHRDLFPRNPLSPHHSTRESCMPGAKRLRTSD